jgi:hypothetical protein
MDVAGDFNFFFRAILLAFHCVILIVEIPCGSVSSKAEPSPAGHDAMYRTVSPKPDIGFVNGKLGMNVSRAVSN